MHAKRFLPTENFKPKFLIPNAERYLAQLRAVSEEVISADDTWFSSLPDIGVVPTPSRRVEPDLLRQFLAIMRARQGVTVEYQSMNDSRPAPMWRGITPHALATDGLRWHLRAYCHIDRKFKDFIISRCLKIGDVGPPLVKAEDDREWSTFFNVILIPNPKLSRHQQTTIERDYGMSDGKCVLKVRLALLYYLDKRLRLDIAETHDRVKEAPVVVANRSEYEQRLKLVAY